MSDFDLIDGAFKIGVIDREGQKLLQQARETRIYLVDIHKVATLI